MFVDVIAVRIMQMSVVHVVGVTIVLECGVTAANAVFVIVLRVRFVCHAPIKLLAHSEVNDALNLRTLLHSHFPSNTTPWRGRLAG